MAENKKSPAKGAFVIPTAIWALGAMGAMGGINQAGKRDRANRAKLEGYENEFDERLATYEESEFQPLDADLYKQENVYEELEVDTQAADYAREQFQQQQANIMQSMRGVAGGSGVAGLAQALSNQSADQARQSQLTIGQQLVQNRKLALQEQSRLNEQQRQIAIANAQGARQFEQDKMSTLIGVSGQRVAGAQGVIAQRQQMYGQIAQGVGSVLGAVIPKINFG